jgi:hypothetical protein
MDNMDRAPARARSLQPLARASSRGASAVTCSECGRDPCVCDRKPSDRPDATRTRKAKSRHKQTRRERFEAWLEDYNRLLCGYSGASRIFRLLPIVTPANLRAAILAHEEELQTLPDYWWVAMGIRDLPSAWNSREQLALSALLNERRDPGGAGKEAEGDAGRYFNKWYRSDWDWSGLAHQLVREQSTDTTDQTDCRDLMKDAGRYQQRKRPRAIIGPPWFLRPVHLVECIRNGGRQYDLYGKLNARGKYHWDSPALHFGEIEKDAWKSVNRAIFKCPIPGTVAAPEAFRPSRWKGRSEVAVKIGPYWISGKLLESEHRATRAWQLQRINRLPQVRAELAKLVPGYTPPPRKPINYIGTRRPAKPIDPWQIEAEQALVLASPPTTSRLELLRAHLALYQQGRDTLSPTRFL